MRRLALLLLLASCAKGTAPLGEHEAEVDRFARARCAYHARCDVRSLQFRGHDQNECIAYVRALYFHELELSRGAIELDRSRVSTPAIDRCIELLATGDCDFFNPRWEGCFSMLEGTGAIDAPCSLHSECSSRYCGSSRWSECSKCGAPIAPAPTSRALLEGEACSEVSDACAQRMALRCHEGQCRPLVWKEKDQPCTGPLDECLAVSYCDRGYCSEYDEEEPKEWQLCE